MGEGEFEVAVKFLAPGVDFGPEEFAAFYGEEFVAVGFDADGDAGFAQGGGAGEEKAEEVHGVFPADFAVVADVLLDLLELGHGVAVEGLEDHLAEEGFADGEKLLGERRDLFDDGRVEAFEDVWIRFQGHDQELLQFPIAGLGGVVLELLGRAEERPLEVGGGNIDSAAIDVGVVCFETVSTGTNDAAVDDELLEVEISDV